MMKQVRVLALILIASASAALVTCSEWPPFEEDIRKNLTENREIFEELEAILDETGYGIISWMATGSVEVGYETNGEIEYDYIDDDKGWGELLSNARVTDVSRNEDVFFFMIGESNEGAVYTRYKYIHHLDADSELKKCMPSHREISCGECIVKLDDQWWVYYMWFPHTIAEGELDALMNGEITQAEYDQRSDEAIDTCWRDGYAEMGYEIPHDRDE